MNLNPLRIGQCIPQLKECDVRVLRDQFFKKKPGTEPACLVPAGVPEAQVRPALSS